MCGMVGVALGIICLAPATVTGQQQLPSISGFRPASATSELATEHEMASMLENDSTGKYFRYLTEEPHIAGSPRNKELADYVEAHFKAYGLEDVAMHRYDVLLPYPEHVSVTMLEPYEFKASLKEDGYPEDKDSYDAKVGMTYMGMSASGDVTGDLIYANSGNPADYDWLESQGIQVAGKIAIVRYSVPYSYRGFKALTAQRRGIKALIIYSDPADDGYRKGLTFPNGPWGPASHIQRGSITYDFIVPGDPLTPGWASVEGAKRIPESEARSVPHVIVVPMSYQDARPMLEHLGGPVAPLAWQGGLPFTYRVGPGATKLRVDVQMDDSTRSIWVVEGRVRGSEHPDQLVVLGNHRDAWVYGAVDPSSGTATQIELARVLGKLLKDGHRPRRTIVLADWDAEEWHLTGSTEWGEQFAPQLSAGGIAYLNVDGSTSGSHFIAGAVASMNRLVIETLRDVVDPNTRRSMLEAFTRDQEAEEGAAAGATPNPIDFVSNRLGSGSDYTVFLNHLGLPIVDMAFDGPYGVYHSQYDDFYWMTHFGDPGFHYMTAMAEVWGRMAMRLANADVLPLDFQLYAKRVGDFLDALGKQPGVAEHLDLGAARAAQQSWVAAADKLEQGTTAALSGGGTASFAPLNAQLLHVERGFLLDQGIPNRPYFKHVLYAPKETYAAMTFPGVQEAVDKGDWALARDQLGQLTERFQAVGKAVQQAAALVPAH
jgi:N-acetylated-alpha-linked acidic dipeptidase